MEKIRQFLSLYDDSSEYKERFLSLYNALYLLLKDEMWERVEEVGIKRERMEDALLYVREDEERGGKTVLSEEELSSLRSLVSLSVDN